MSPKRLHPVDVNKQQDLNLSTQDISGAQVTAMAATIDS